MNDNIIFNELVFGFILLFLGFAGGLALPFAKEIKGKKVVGYSKKELSIAWLVLSAMAWPMEIYIVLADNGYSWAKEGPWWAAMFFTSFHIVIVGAILSMVALMAIALGYVVAFAITSKKVHTENRRARTRRAHIEEFKNEFHNETDREIEILNSWVE